MVLIKSISYNELMMISHPTSHTQQIKKVKPSISQGLQQIIIQVNDQKRKSSVEYVKILLINEYVEVLQ